MGLIDYAGLLRRGSGAQSLGESGLSRGTHKVLTAYRRREGRDFRAGRRRVSGS